MEVLVASARGLANFETVRKSAEELIYDRSKGCPKYWTVLRFILELLTLKAKHSWSDGSFNDERIDGPRGGVNWAFFNF